MVVIHIWEKAQWDNLLGGGIGLVAVFFSAAWCANCRMIQAHFYNLSEGLPNVSFAEVDVDDAESLAKELGISYMPTFQFYKLGRKVAQFSGIKREKLEYFLDELQ